MNFLVGDGTIVDEREKRQRYGRCIASVGSEWCVMIIVSPRTPIVLQPITRWAEELFDIIIADSCKPNFQEDGHQPLFSVNSEDDSLNLVQCDDGQFSLGESKENVIERGNHVFQGGNWQHLHAMLGLKSGDKVGSKHHHPRAFGTSPSLVTVCNVSRGQASDCCSGLYNTLYYYY